jgi:hypothetical protein
MSLLKQQNNDVNAPNSELCMKYSPLFSLLTLISAHQQVFVATITPGFAA